MILSDAFDLIVIGCGPAGEKAAAQAAYFGKRVAVIDRAEHLGGNCINTGTVPSKTLPSTISCTTSAKLSTWSANAF